VEVPGLPEFCSFYSYNLISLLRGAGKHYLVLPTYSAFLFKNTAFG